MVIMIVRAVNRRRFLGMSFNGQYVQLKLKKTIIKAAKPPKIVEK